MFAARYFAPRHFANRYFPPIGAVIELVGTAIRYVYPHRRYRMRRAR